ncbi:MAG TPA: hypothetical protein VEH04_09350 [Verrucomicrobiae bacterium]|nr:hypothetical protein [Verrucomicrobiae bacterium]
MSRGCLLAGGYFHIAIQHHPDDLRSVLAHELTHDCVAFLPLPLWINEGLAQRVDRSVGLTAEPLIDFDLKERHLAFWNETNIQQFWAGVSFSSVGDAQQLSYSLAEILLTLAEEQSGDHASFLRNAHYDDAGQTAAFDHLGVDLADLASTFLGPGEWRPNRKAIADAWEQWQTRVPNEAE